MNGTLYICATPIGNLEDISLRVLRILKEVSLIAAEDTRHTQKLLNFYDIKTPLTSYYKYNAAEKGQKLIERLKAGQDIALVTDAGMPCISDPGEEIVKLCYENEVPVTAAPGATAAVTALALSGFPTGKFVFEGFLPVQKSQRINALNELKKETRTIVFYAAPHHIKKTLQDILEVMGDRSIAITRELTKKFEEIFRTTLSEAVEFYENNEPKGEFVLVLAGITQQEIEQENAKKFENLSLQEHVKLYMENNNWDKKTAMKAVAKERKISKSEVYDALIKE